jgi:hypothetical protein
VTFDQFRQELASVAEFQPYILEFAARDGTGEIDQIELTPVGAIWRKGQPDEIPGDWAVVLRSADRKSATSPIWLTKHERESRGQEAMPGIIRRLKEAMCRNC